MTQDKFLWLEDILAKPALQWVDEQNKKTQQYVADEKTLQEKSKKIEDILNHSDPLLYLTIIGKYAYRSHKTAKNQLGVLQRLPVDAFCQGNTEWKNILDIQALSQKEKKEYTLQKLVVLDTSEGGNRALLLLSNGGKDACEVKEFDLDKGQFVQENPFTLAEGKHDIIWEDKDTCLVAWGEGKLSKSGYPLEVRRLKRGMDITDAPTIFTGSEDKVGVTFHPQKDKGDVYLEDSDFFTMDIYVIAKGGHPKKIAITENIEAFSHMEDGKIVSEVNDDWNIPGRFVPAGSVIRFHKDDPQGTLEVLFIPKKNESIGQIKVVNGAVFIALNRNAHSSLIKITPDRKKQEIVLPHNFVTIDRLTSQKDSPYLIISLSGFLQPKSYYLLDTQQEHPCFKLLDLMQAAFDPQLFIVKQTWIKSQDGTEFPYYLIHKKDIKLDGHNPTLLYGYGGFNISLTPHYPRVKGVEFLEKGGVYALANIRGGGEFGPKWHEAAMKEKRHKAYEDFIATAEDLVAKGYTSPAKLAIQGGSNGGLLVGNMLTQRPDLFKVVLCGVPLLDMKRYHLLLAGESWTREFGNPDIPGEWEFLRKYSPYHNLQQGVQYPHCLFTTTTLDDRVHPAHARKMVAKMQDMQVDAWLFENRNGGHGTGVTAQDQARQLAIEVLFLQKHLF